MNVDWVEVSSHRLFPCHTTPFSPHLVFHQLSTWLFWYNWCRCVLHGVFYVLSFCIILCNDHAGSGPIQPAPPPPPSPFLSTIDMLICSSHQWCLWFVGCTGLCGMARTQPTRLALSPSQTNSPNFASFRISSTTMWVPQCQMALPSKTRMRNTAFCLTHSSSCTSECEQGIIAESLLLSLTKSLFQTVSSVNIYLLFECKHWK